MRLFSIKEAIEGTEVENKIEIISYPEIFGKKGFHGVVAEIKRLNPLQVIHGLHGNDFDGMSVRRIYDESGWIFPYYAKVARWNKCSNIYRSAVFHFEYFEYAGRLAEIALKK